jgi:hypothetical protein
LDFLHGSRCLQFPAASGVAFGLTRRHGSERSSVVKMKWTVSKILFAIATVLFILAFLSVKVSDFDLVSAGLACAAAGLFFEGVM